MLLNITLIFHVHNAIKACTIEIILKRVMSNTKKLYTLMLTAWKNGNIIGWMSRVRNQIKAIP